MRWCLTWIIVWQIEVKPNLLVYYQKSVCHHSSGTKFQLHAFCNHLQLTYLLVKNLSFFGVRWNVGLAIVKGSRKRRTTVKKRKEKKRIDEIAAYLMNTPTDSFSDTVKLAGYYRFPNIQQLLTMRWKVQYLP